MRQFKMLEHYQKTELQAAIVNAMIALFIETPMDPESLEQLFSAVQETQSLTTDRMTAPRAPLRGGGIYPLYPRRKGLFPQPQPAGRGLCALCGLAFRRH